MSFLIDRVEAVLARLESLFLVVANLCLAAMLLLNLFNIVVGAVAERAWVWIFPWTTVLFVWCSFIGMFVVYRRGTDITVDFFYARLDAAGRMAMRIFADVVVISVLVLLLTVAPKIIATQQGEVELTGVYRWMLSLPLFVSSFLVALDVALDLARAAIGLPSRGRGHGAVV
jgi:TRAP-type C4-dicarboxylate transport system permease small subunit